MNGSRGRWLGAILITTAATVVVRSATPVAVTVHVKSSETGRPLPSARVAIGEEHSDVFEGLTTGVSGQVTFSHLSPGRYRLRAVATGYRSMMFGEEPGLGSTIVVLAADQPPLEFTLALHRGSTIAGVVTNDLKEPVVDAEVRATGRQWIGEQRLIASAFDKTDDRGAYRIIGLEAGQYYVSAADGLSVAFASAPGARGNPREITVGPDAEQAGVNIQTKPFPAGTISGSVAGPGAGAAGVNVLLMQDAAVAGFAPVTTARVGPGAQFSIADVPVGRYELIVRPGSDQAHPRAWARTSVVVAAGEATASLALYPGARISGTVAAPAGVRGSVGLAPLGIEHPEAAFAGSTTGGAGAFVVQNVAPGRYRWVQTTFPSMPDSDYVLSAFVNEKDISDVPLEVTPDATIDNVRVTITPPARVSGTMLDAAGKPTSRGAVIVASTAARDWTEATRRVRLVRPDTAGFYQISGLPPGLYTVSAVTALSPGQLWDPTFLKTLAKSRQVTLSQGQTIAIDLRLK